jgi:hypothetical protein
VTPRQSWASPPARCGLQALDVARASLEPHHEIKDLRRELQAVAEAA